MTVTLARGVTATDVEGGLVLLDQRRGRYWQLNGSGASAMRMLLEGQPATAIAAHLAHGDPATAERALADVADLVAALRKARLVQGS